MMYADDTLCSSSFSRENSLLQRRENRPDTMTKKSVDNTVILTGSGQGRVRRQNGERSPSTTRSVLCPFHEVAMGTRKTTKWRKKSVDKMLCFLPFSRGRQEGFGSTTGNREYTVWTHFSLFLLFTRSPERIRQNHWKQRMNGVDTLFVVSTLHEVTRKNSVVPLETEDDVDALSVLHEVRREHSGGNERKGK